MVINWIHLTKFIFAYQKIFKTNVWNRYLSAKSPFEFVFSSCEFTKVISHQPKRRIMRRPRTSILSIVVYIFEIEDSDETRYETTNKTSKKETNHIIFVELSNDKFQNGIQFDLIFDSENLKIRLHFRSRKF